MTYNSKLVVVIKVNGKVLREQGDTVYIPFGSEYTIYMKNLNTQRCVATVSIDGKEMKRSFVIEPNSDLEVERFVEEDLRKGYKLKFIEKTKEISRYRGDKAEDGIIRIEYKYEKYVPPIASPYVSKRSPWDNPDPYFPKRSPWDNPDPYFPHSPYWVNTSSSIDDMVFGTSLDSDMSCYMCDCSGPSTNSRLYKSAIPKNDNGITVNGSDSKQQFHEVSVGELEDETHAICILLKGDIQRDQPVYVKSKLICSSCGKSNRSTNMFCSNCGTRLI